MSRFKLSVAVLPVLLLLSGCATVTLPQGPDIYSFTQRPDASTILVARAVDQRVNKQKLGNISALSISMKADPVEMVGKEVVASLYRQGFNGRLEPISADQPAGFAQAAQQVNADGVLAVSIQSISVKSFDAVLDPPTAEFVLQATLYDRDGKAVGSSSATGHVQRRINSFTTEKSVGELVAEAAHDAAERLIGAGSMASSLQKLTVEETPPEEPEEPETAPEAPVQETIPAQPETQEVQ